MSWADENLEDLSNRADRSLGHVDLDTLFNHWRRIVGPRPEQMSVLAREAYEAIRSGLEPAAEQRQALERAIRLMRPARPVRAGTLDPLDPQAAGVFPDWSAFACAGEQYLPAVGRIDIPPRRPDEGVQPFATGFAIAEGRLVTNDHVVGELTLGTGHFIPGQAEVRFGQELGRGRDPAPVRIEGVVARDPDLDLAVLAIGPRPQAAAVIPLDIVEIGVGTAVAAVGFPIPGPVDPGVAGALVGDAFGIKRVSPGLVIARQEGVLAHDCTTLGGSSGSPVLTLVGAKLAGVHYDGWYLTRNHAACGAPLRRFLKENVR